MVKYFGVFYLKNGATYFTIPSDTQKECLDKMKKWLTNSNEAKQVEATTVIKRNMDNFKDNHIFGCPKSLNLVK